MEKINYKDIKINKDGTVDLGSNASKLTGDDTSLPELKAAPSINSSCSNANCGGSSNSGSCSNSSYCGGSTNQGSC